MYLFDVHARSMKCETMYSFMHTAILIVLHKTKTKQKLRENSKLSIKFKAFYTCVATSI